MAYIKTKGLSFSYPESRKKALNKIDIQINEGELVLVMGKSGSGKSTLLKLFKPELAPYGESQGELTNTFERSGFVVQNPDAGFVSQGVRGELVFALENKGLNNDKIAVRLGEIASFFNLTHLLDRRLETLSGGERATVAIASAIIDNAELLMLDEPLAQLDPRAVAHIISLIKRINTELGTTVIISSHISDGIVDGADRLVILDNGNIVFNDAPHNVTKNSIAVSFMPSYTSMFDECPLTVKEAIALSKGFRQRAVVKKEFTETAVKLKNIYFSYGKKDRDILDCLSLEIKKSSVHSIIGANGSGKTTLLKVIAGIRRQYSGSVKVSGKIAYLPQNPQYLFTRDTVLEEVGEEGAKKLCGDDYKVRHPYDLSSGEMQQLALLMLERQGFDIILMDEPAKSLDYYAKSKLKSYIKGLTEKGKTVVIVSHDIDFVGDISDTVSFLSDGIITITGGRREVLSSLDFYTTQIRRITKKSLSDAVSAEDIE